MAARNVISAITGLNATNKEMLLTCLDHGLMTTFGVLSLYCEYFHRMPIIMLPCLFIHGCCVENCIYSSHLPESTDEITFYIIVLSFWMLHTVPTCLFFLDL